MGASTSTRLRVRVRLGGGLSYCLRESRTSSTTNRISSAHAAAWMYNDPYFISLAKNERRGSRARCCCCSGGKTGHSVSRTHGQRARARDCRALTAAGPLRVVVVRGGGPSSEHEVLVVGVAGPTQPRTRSVGLHGCTRAPCQAAARRGIPEPSPLCDCAPRAGPRAAAPASRRENRRVH